jgi:ribosomal protein S13
MDADPMQFLEEDGDKKATETITAAKKPKAHLNTMVAISVALLATFMGICKVKDDNIVQAMQQAQADKIDNYSWYQARNVREEVANATVAELTAQAAAAPPQAKAAYDEQIKTYQALAQEQGAKKKTQQADADKADQTYNELNFHDDQFDLSDAMLALAISLLAVTALTQKRWLFVLAMFPTVFGVVMGLAGLLGWHIHPNLLTRLLS